MQSHCLAPLLFLTLLASQIARHFVHKKNPALFAQSGVCFQPTECLVQVRPDFTHGGIHQARENREINKHHKAGPLARFQLWLSRPI
jgi:hypothetical protein